MHAQSRHLQKRKISIDEQVAEKCFKTLQHTYAYIYLYFFLEMLLLNQNLWPAAIPKKP